MAVARQAPCRDRQAIRHADRALRHRDDALAAEADAQRFIRRNGWIKAFRTHKEQDARLAEAARWNREFGLNYKRWTQPLSRHSKPHLAPILIGALHWTDPTNVNDPQGLARAYLARFEALGGRFIAADARSLVQGNGEWSVKSYAGETITARDAVVALGPWAGEITQPLGYKLPLAVKPRLSHALHHARQRHAEPPGARSERGYFLAR